MIRAIVILSVAACLLSGGEAWEPRLQPDPAALDALMRDERWALVQAQEAYGRKQWKAAVALYQKFTISFPDSAMWSYGAYRLAECLLRDEQLEGAIKAAVTVADIDAKAPETPEALLLVARAQRLAGKIDAAQATARRILTDYPTTPAATPARLEADGCLQLQAKRPGKTMKQEELDHARLSLLAVAADPIDLNPLNERAVAEVLEALTDLALAHKEWAQVAKLITALNAPSARPERRRLREVRDRAVTRGLDATLWADDAPGLAAIAQASWAEVPQRAAGQARTVLDWTEAVRRNPADWGKALGRDTPAAEARIAARLAATETALVAAVPLLSKRERGDGAWLLARARLAQRQVEPAIAALGPDPLDRGAATGFLDLAVRGGNPPAAARAILARVPEGLERRRATMDMARWEAHRGGERAPMVGKEALALAVELEASDPDSAPSYLEVQAELQRRVLRDFDAAIVAYGKINKPPGTDMAIAECLQEKGEPAKAMAKYLEIHALYAQSGQGPQALLRAGLLAHKPLELKARAIDLLRRVCDDYPGSGAYSHAHRYLQSELGVTYTGGGGQRKEK
jgi:TolA-binding protein